MNLIWKGSPNFSGNMGVKTHIVIHWFGMGDLESANATFQRASGDNRTSAHYGISDNTVYQWVHEANVALHAFSANPYSIGIEHHARADYPATDATYKTSSQLVAEIAGRHHIPLDRQHIIPHRQVVNTQCPGTLDLDRIIRRAIHIQGGVEEVTRIEAFQRVFIATAQRWPNEMETKAWESSGMEDYTWCQRFAPNPTVNDLKALEIYQQVREEAGVTYPGGAVQFALDRVQGGDNFQKVLKGDLTHYIGRSVLAEQLLNKDTPAPLSVEDQKNLQAGKTFRTLLKEAS